MSHTLAGRRVVNLQIGGVYATRQAVAVRTVLGSCVAACLYDPVAAIGGMNHFMLPHPLRNDNQLPARYGVHAMELLINRIMKLGGDRERFRAKLFGGANVLYSSNPASNVADRNAKFARDFLDQEGIPLVSWRTGGVEALEVVFFPQTSQALVKPVRRISAGELAAREARYASDLDKRAARSSGSEVTLFE